MPSVGEIFADVGLKIDNSGLTSATSMFKSAEASLTGIGNVAKTTGTTISSSLGSGGFGAALDQMNVAMSGVTASAGAAKFGVTGFSSAVSAMSSIATSSGTSLTGLGNSATLASNTISGKLTSGILNVGTSLTGLASKSSTFQTLSAGAQKAGSALVDLTQKSTALKNEMGTLGTVITGMFTGALVSGISNVVSTFSSFDDKMRQVQAVTSATGDQFSQLSAEATKLGADTSFTAQEVANGMVVLGQAGRNADEVYQSMPGTLNLARSSMTGLSTSVDILTTTMTGFQMGANQTGVAADVLAKAANISATDVTGIGDAMKYTSSLAHEMDWSLQATTAAVGLLSNAGIKGEMAGTVLRNSITRLLAPTKQVADTLSKYGITVDAISPKTHSLAQIMDLLAAKGVSAGDIMTIFGMRAGPGMLALLAQGSKGLSDYTQKLEDSAGYAKKAADEMDAGIGGAIRQIQGSLETLQITMGEDIAYSLKYVLLAGAKILNLYQLIPSPIRKVGSAFVLLGAGALVAVSGLGTLGILVGAAGPALGVLGISADIAAGSITAFGLTLSAVEWATGIGEIAALAAALIYLDEKTGIVSSTLSFLYDAVTVDFYKMKEIVGGAINYISGYIDELVSDLNSISTGLHLDSVTGYFTSLKDAVSGIVSSVHGQAEESRNAADDIETNIFDASSQVQNSASVAEKAHDIWGDSAQNLALTAEDAYGNVTGSVSDAQYEYQEAVNKFLGDIDTVSTAGIEVMSGVDIDDLTRGIKTVDGELLILNDDLELVKIAADGTITPLKNMGEQHFQTTSGGLTILTQGANDTGEAMSRADTLVGDLDQDVVVLNGRTLTGLNGQVGTVQLSVSDTTRLVDEVTGSVSILDSKTLSNLNGQINGVDSSINTANGNTGTWGNTLGTTNLIPMSTLLAQTQGVDSQINLNNSDTVAWNSTLGSTNNAPFSMIQGNLSATGLSIDSDTTKTGNLNLTLGGTNAAPFGTVQGNLGTTGVMIDTNQSKTGILNSTLGNTNNSPFGTLFGNLSTGGTHVDTLKGKTDDANASMSTLGGFSFSTTLSSLNSIYDTLGNIYERAVDTISKLRNIGSSSGSSSSSNSSSTTNNNTTNNTNVTIKTYAAESNVTKWVKRATGN